MVLGIQIEIWNFHIIAFCFYSQFVQCPNFFGIGFVYMYMYICVCVYIYIYIYIYIYSQVHKYWDIDTILTFLALYTTTMDFKWNEQDVL